MTEKLLNALYRGPLPIGGLTLDCYIVDDDDKNPTRILSTKAIFDAFKRPVRGSRSIDTFKLPNGNMIELPPFIASGALIPLINQSIMNMIEPIVFMDGNQRRVGYKAELLPEICALYLRARRGEKGVKLLAHQMPLAEQAEILQESLAKVGIIALVDEATGFQTNRKSDALRQLLQVYLADGIKKWIKEFPDDFFYELDRLYCNENLKSNQRPSYYGTFINKYVYEPIEKGRINPELQKRYIADNKINRKHQHFTDLGSNQLRIQIGKVLGAMQIAPNLKWFKQKQERLGQLSLFPDME